MWLLQPAIILPAFSSFFHDLYQKKIQIVWLPGPGRVESLQDKGDKPPTVISSEIPVETQRSIWFLHRKKILLVISFFFMRKYNFQLVHKSVCVNNSWLLGLQVWTGRRTEGNVKIQLRKAPTQPYASWKNQVVVQLETSYLKRYIGSHVPPVCH